MFLSIIDSKYGVDYKFTKTLKEARIFLDKSAKDISRNKEKTRLNYELGPYDSWSIYKINKKKEKEDLIKYLNDLFNLIFVNSSLLKKIEYRD